MISREHIQMHMDIGAVLTQFSWYAAQQPDCMAYHLSERITSLSQSSHLVYIIQYYKCTVATGSTLCIS
ncbi:hypothetical protein BDQ17DRAFT_416190 [Cyathus striatus]|nr:hypothetical protein BDQ17DRAFT_416190 [Cyathus striatus]